MSYDRTAADKRYAQSEKGRARAAKYVRTEKGKTSRNKYGSSLRGRLHKAVWQNDHLNAIDAEKLKEVESAGA